MYVRNSGSLGWNLFSRQAHPLSICARGNAFLFTRHIWMENVVRFTFARMTNRPKERCISGRRKSRRYLTLFLRIFGLHIRPSYEKWVFGYRQLAKDETCTKLENLYALRTNDQRLEIFLRMLEDALTNKNPKVLEMRNECPKWFLRRISGVNCVSPRAFQISYSD